MRSPVQIWLAAPYAAIAQSVERILGKDEVASSNLASSSKKKHIHLDVLLFGFESSNLAGSAKTPDSEHESGVFLRFAIHSTRYCYV